MSASFRTLTLAAAGALVCSAGAHAASDPTGIWFDHNGRGAVEIAPCAGGKGLCGYVIHIKEARNNGRCGLQILGNVTSGMEVADAIFQASGGEELPSDPVAMTRVTVANP